MLQSEIIVYTIKPNMGRPPKPEHLRRAKMLPIRLTADEMAELEAAAKNSGISVAEILRQGAALYIRKRGKDGSKKLKERKQ
jgi:hypothetical protein